MRKTRETRRFGNPYSHEHFYVDEKAPDKFYHQDGNLSPYVRACAAFIPANDNITYMEVEAGGGGPMLKKMPMHLWHILMCDCVRWMHEYSLEFEDDEKVPPYLVHVGLLLDYDDDSFVWYMDTVWNI